MAKQDLNARLKKYGITEEDFNAMLEKQGYRCAICGSDNDGRELAIDHDHVTGEVRGLLCTKCNLGLGSFEDDITRLEKAKLYLGKALYNHPLCGRFFLTPHESGGWQGQIVEYLGNGIFLAQLFSWFTGYATNEVTINLSETAGWKFYKTIEDWQYAGENFAKI
jgi:DNA-directed RNA polymerase subunit RPC12/RpoP